MIYLVSISTYLIKEEKFHLVLISGSLFGCFFKFNILLFNRQKSIKILWNSIDQNDMSKNYNKKFKLKRNV